MITKLELIEYLKHTPENTNYNILRSGLYNGSNKEVVDEFIEVLSRGNLSLAALQPYLAKLYEDDKTISPEPLPPFSSGGGSVPKPLTYDYMPEGYPTKTVQTTTLMEEQQVAFTLNNGKYIAEITNPFEIVEGQTYIVNWDGAEYECVCFAFKSKHFIGNLSIAGASDDTGEPFLCIPVEYLFATLDTSATHTISVKTTGEIVTPMAEEFIPSGVTAAIENAQVTAETAKTTANKALATANNAEATANNAQRIANNVEAAANNAQATADGCVKTNNDGSFGIYLNDNSYFSGSNSTGKPYYSFRQNSTTDTPITLSIGALGGTDLEVSVTPSTSPTVKIAPPVYLNKQADIEIVSRLSSAKPQISGLGGIIMYSSTADSTKKFKITVDDSGTISATEVT